MGTLEDSEDLVEMTHNVAFIRVCTVCYDYNNLQGQKKTSYFRKFYMRPIKIHNGQSHTYCISMHGEIYQNTKG